MWTRGPTFGFRFPNIIGEEIKIQNWFSVVEMFEFKDLATKNL